METYTGVIYDKVEKELEIDFDVGCTSPYTTVARTVYDGVIEHNIAYVDTANHKIYMYGLLFDFIIICKGMEVIVEGHTGDGHNSYIMYGINKILSLLGWTPFFTVVLKNIPD